MLVADNLERRVLFKLTRLVALFFVFIFTLPIILGIIYFSVQMIPPSIQISEDEVIATLKPENQVSNGETATAETSSIEKNISISADVLKSQNLSFTIQKYFSEQENMKIIRAWLEPLTFHEREEFLNELERVIKRAETEHLDVVQAINTYANLKMQKVSRRASDGRFSPMTYGVFFGVIGGCILFIALFSLILVLLAIERNTRERTI